MSGSLSSNKKGIFSRAMNLFTRRNRPTQKQHPYHLGRVATDETQVKVDQFNYDWATLGRDHKKPVPPNKPMIKVQMNYLKSFGISFIDYLGADTYGRIWRVKVKQRDIRSVLTCKILSLNTFDANRRRITSVKEAVTAMFHEITILRQLNHPNVIRLEYVLKVPDSKTRFPYSSVCMLMENSHGTLKDMIQIPVSGVLLEDDCRQWFAQIGEAVRYLHHKNVVHMNIKPESIRFVFRNRTVFKLSDFCYSIDFGEGMPSFTNIKLIGYCMAPEVRREGPLEEYDAKAADIFSLGITLIVALIGLRTHPQVMLNDLRQRQWMDILYMPFPLTSQLAELLILMTEVDPNDRLTIDEVCDHKWLFPEENCLEYN